MARTISSNLSCVAACSRRCAWCSTNTMTSVIALATVENANCHESGNPATARATMNPKTTTPTTAAAAELPTIRSRRRTCRLTRERDGTTGSIAPLYPKAEVFHLCCGGDWLEVTSAQPADV